jgi:hypothetical protein
MTETTRPRSLADDLRSRSDDELAQLLRSRPDLLNPVPSDVGTLAARAATRASVQRALDNLDLFALEVVEVLCALADPVDPADVERLLGAAPREPLESLRTQALLYGAPGPVSLVRTVRELVGPPAGLGPPATQALQTYGPARLQQLLADLDLPGTGDPVAAVDRVGELIADRAAFDKLLSGAPAGAKEALESLTWTSTGALQRARRDVDAATASPVEWLLAHGLVVAADSSTVVVPREVGLHLRGERVHAVVHPVPPAPAAVPADRARVAATASHSAARAVQVAEDVLRLWSETPPRVLRTGGLGVRDRNRAAAVIGVDEALLSLVLESSWEAGLLDSQEGETWLPTRSYDDWRVASTSSQWLALATAWLASTRVAGLAGSRDSRDRVLVPLGPDLDRMAAPGLRRSALDVLAGADGAVAPDSVAEVLHWHGPRRGGRWRDDLVRWSLQEAEMLGVVGAGALTEPGRALLAGDPARAEQLMAALLPRPVDHVLLQADLTAVAPGPLRPDLDAELRLMADVESTGGATVYRFSAGSVRRALDAGRTADEIQRRLESASQTPVPQPLSYLVADVARRHGRLRVGAASAYLYCDDPAVLDEVVADRRSNALLLRRLAPTVVASRVSAETLLDRLREMGHAPAAENEAGEVVLGPRRSARASSRRRTTRQVGEPAAPRDTLLTAAVRAIRAGDRASSAGARATGTVAGLLVGRPSADVLAALAEAVAAQSSLWLGYVNAEGQASQRIVEPIAVEGGYLTAFDHLRDEVRTFSVHRITGVAAVDEPA